MHAMLVDADKNLHWTEVPDPVRKEGEVLLEIHAAALNRADLLQRDGKYPPPPGWPEWMGLEVAGIVLAADEAGRWKPGDRVCALLGGGGYAEKVALPECMVMPIPKGCSMEEAAALPEAFATSYLNLYLEAGLKPEETVLIQAGASGLGMAAIQLAKAFGSTVMTTVGNDEKAEVVRKLGADIVVNRKKENLAEIMERNPVHVAMDCAGGEALGQCIEKMAVGGRWILIATLGGEHTTLALRPFLKRGLHLTGSTLRSRTSEMKGFILNELVKKVWPKIEDGSIRPLLHKILPVADAEKAHAILREQKNAGKVVLRIREESK